MSNARPLTVAVLPESDGSLAETTQADSLESPLAEIAAETATKRDAKVARRGVSPRQRRRLSRTKKRGSFRSKKLALSPGDVIVGTLIGLNDAGEPLVRHPIDSRGRPVLARTTIPLDHSHVDREVVIAFERGDLRKPIVLGVLWRRDDCALHSPDRQCTSQQVPCAAEIDGEQLVLTAQREVVLRCGDASLTLTRAGKVLIRGTYVRSYSSGVNRIQGGSVQIN
jgi:Domain of unknown function (DUF6484)